MNQTVETIVARWRAQGSPVVQAAVGAYAPGHEFHGNQYTTHYEGEAIKHPDASRFLDSLGERSSDAHNEIGNVLTRGDLKSIVKTDHQGHIVAAVGFESTPEHLTIHHLGSLEKGAGRELVEKLKKGRRGRRFVAHAVVDSAKGFYQKMGFKPHNGNDWIHEG